MSKKSEVIELKPLSAKTVDVTIVGDGDLILNKMNDVTVRTLTNQRKNKAKDIEPETYGKKLLHQCTG